MHNFRSQGLRHRSFAHASLADNHRVIFGATAQDLDNALHLHIAPNNRVNAPMLSIIVQIATVARQHLQHIVLLFQGRLLNAASRHRLTPLVHSPNHIAYNSALNAKLGQHSMGHAIACCQKSPQNLLAAHIIVLQLMR